jgi:ribonucleotide reductase alpha subunit
MSNNSVACDDISKLPQEFWDTYEQGEPYGLINLGLSRKIGRVGETEYPDPDVVAYNPCAEQPLEDGETCCLAETYLPNIKSKEELFKVLTYLYRVNKHSLALHCSIPETEEVVHKNMRMGIGITGLLQATEEQKSWLKDAYEYLREYDKEYSKKLGFPTSIKLTTSKPSGTLSLLAGVTPGANPSPAGPYYIRRVRLSNSSPLVQMCRDNGYFVEPMRHFDGSNDQTTVVVEFPCKVPETTPTGDMIKAVEHLDIIKWVQTNWSDNAVSCTVNYRKEELPEIKKWLEENYTDNVKSVSFLLYYGHGFDQAPYETISKEKYDEMKSKVRPIKSIEVFEKDFEISDCDTGACPIK